jgi:hypothetical protein
VSLIDLDFGSISSDVSVLSSVAIILGVIFVVVQIQQNNQLISATAEQAHAAAVQATLTTEQLKQNNAIANMDMIMRLYEFANTAEVQSASLTVVNANIASYEEFLKLAKTEQVAFYQIGALFESLGVLVQREIVKVEVIDDMFLTRLAWKSMKPFIVGTRERFGEEESYVAFEQLYNMQKTQNSRS